MSPTNGLELAAWAPDIPEAERGASMNQSRRDTSGVFPMEKPNVFFGKNEKAVGESDSKLTKSPKKVLTANCKKNQAVKHKTRNPVIHFGNSPNGIKVVHPLGGRDAGLQFNSENLFQKGEFVQQSMLVMEPPLKSQKKADEKSYLRHRILSSVGARSIEAIPRSHSTSETKKVDASQDFMRNHRDSHPSFSSGIKFTIKKPDHVANTEAIRNHRLAERKINNLKCQDQPMEYFSSIAS